MRTHRRYQYTQNAFFGGLLVLAVLTGTVPQVQATSSAATHEIENNADVVAVTWDKKFREHIQQIWKLFEICPPPVLEDPIETWANRFNDCYATHGIRSGFTQDEVDAFAAEIFATIDHLESGPTRLDPVLYDATMNTLVDMLDDLYSQGQQQ